MAKNIEKDRVVKAGDKALFTQKNWVVEDKPRNKWAGIPMTEEQKKEYAEVWKKVDNCLINYTTIKIKKNSMKTKKPTTENTKKMQKNTTRRTKRK